MFTIKKEKEETPNKVNLSACVWAGEQDGVDGWKVATVSAGQVGAGIGGKRQQRGAFDKYDSIVFLSSALD